MTNRTLYERKEVALYFKGYSQGIWHERVN